MGADVTFYKIGKDRSKGEIISEMRNPDHFVASIFSVKFCRMYNADFNEEYLDHTREIMGCGTEVVTADEIREAYEKAMETANEPWAEKIAGTEEYEKINTNAFKKVFDENADVIMAIC